MKIEDTKTKIFCPIQFLRIEGFQFLATENKFSVSFKTKSFEDLGGKASDTEN